MLPKKQRDGDVAGLVSVFNRTEGWALERAEL
jgi:hypothetical protein